VADTSLTVVGAGVVGLAVAARLARRFSDLVVLERRERTGQETSSRNSEIIHAGMYYPPGSLKARLSVRGNALLYELCARHAIPHRRIGKLIVALDGSEVPALLGLLERGRANGTELRLLSAAESQALEPNVPAVAALLSPNTGIVSAHGLMDHFAQQARAAGAVVQLRTELLGLERHPDGYRLTVRAGEMVESFTSERVVNVAGLDADKVAGLAGIDLNAAGYRQHWWKGSYFSVPPARAGLVERLVYPVPGHVSLGVHVVIGLDGRLRFGPDADYLADRQFDYRVDAAKRPAFAASARRLVPALREEDFEPDMAGIRAKLQGPGEGFRDFVIAEERARGLPGLVNLIGIDSPGLTSSPAIAEEVERLLDRAS
jgi:L-2-hydroxyglutarate oxidase LhgO